jgi:spore coat polysaccharide biosynthesis protein SpsF
MKVVAIIQARMGSRRLPGKVLECLLAGETVLGCVVNRVSRAARVDEVVVATTTTRRDDAIADLCATRGWSCFRGDEDDVLSRYWNAARVHGADAVVRVTSDCPLIDPDVIDGHVERLLDGWHRVDFVTNMMRQTFPLGLAVEAMPLDVLARMDRLSTTPYLREHVTTLAYEQPTWFVVDHILNALDLSAMRWTVDTASDLAFVRCVFRHFGHDRFGWRDVLTPLAEHPEWGMPQGADAGQQVGCGGAETLDRPC